jgi:hypothetical protein
MIGLNYLGKMGQLGNQMFQYAALQGIAAKHNYKTIIPSHPDVIVDALGNKLRIELFDAFDLPMGPMDVGYVPHDRNLQEPHYHFSQELLDNCPDNVSLVGYFQSEKYFKHIEDDIRKLFGPKEAALSCWASTQHLFDNPVALHIRRGDFLINSVHHHNLSMKYYETALRAFGKERQVIIFSDDTDWCKQQPLFEGDRFLVCEGGGPYTDLYMMSKCDDFIIANSTFSWWGAWLSRNEDKLVIYPDRWFGPNNIDKSTADLFPPKWRMINEH